MLVTLLFLLLLTILGASSLYTAYTEVVLSKNIEADASAFYKADSAIEQTLYWFHYPEQFNGTPANFFSRKMINNTSFLSENGISQYTGTKLNPALAYSGNDYLLSIYAPVVPGAICTVSGTGVSGRIKRTVTVELYEEAGQVKILRGTWRAN